jgi:DNA polymerase-3 subunit delta'
MPFAEILGQARAVSRLRNAVAAGRLAQAYSFVGPEGVGKRLTALALAQAVNCQARGVGSDACGVCVACRKIAAGGHPDVILVGPADKTVIGIEQIREVAARAGRRAYEGAVKVWIVDPAERMQEPAANAFLKTLEEPPGASLFLLLTTTPSALLPTIRSRCQEVRFDLLSAEILEEILARQGRPAEERSLAAALAGGSAARALALDPEAVREGQERTLGEVFGCLGSLPALLFRAEAIGKDRAGCGALVETLLAFFRDVVVVKVGAPRVPLCSPLWRESAGRTAAAVPLEGLLAVQTALRQAEWALARSANARLTAERLLLRMRETLRISLGEEVAHDSRGAR